MKVMHKLDKGNYVYTHYNDFYIDCVNEYFKDRPISMIEVGVFKASVLKSFMAKNFSFEKYIGVDPYIGDKTDYYHNAYWTNSNEASNVYWESKKIYDSCTNAELIKTTSFDFFMNYNKGHDRKFDIILIDGDHRKEPTLLDMFLGSQYLKEDGIMFIDDYGNSDTPEVTSAINSFISAYEEFIDEIHYAVYPFKNKGKNIPISKMGIMIKFTNYAYNKERERERERERIKVA